MKPYVRGVPPPIGVAVIVTEPLLGFEEELKVTTPALDTLIQVGELPFCDAVHV
ncbi:TPA: hypothetical protein NGH35_002787 [Legionella pneumophila]|nr:hypothetical protein [Legionella pneumophila]HCD9500945.1 hypothetical protein [Legionella pneumophila]